MTVLVVVLYALTPSLRWERGTLYVSAYVRRHFTMLGAVLLLVLAWSYRLGMYRLLAYGGGAGGVFTIVDHHVIVPATLLLSVVTMCAAIVVAWAGWTGQMRLAFGAVTAVLLLSLVSRTIAPLIVRRSLDPGAQQERAYLGTRLNYTRRAYGVGAPRMRADSLGTSFATAADVSSRLAVWDAATLSRAAERLRRVRVVGDGAAWQATTTGMAALLVEHGTEGAPDGRDVWGIDRFDPSSADERGLPLRTPGSALASYDFVLAEPAVYDSAPSYSLMSDSLRQLLGVEMVSTRSRLMHAWSLQNFRLLFGDLPANRPVMVRRRDVRERIEALVPFFVQGSEVVPIVASDSLYWVVELYASGSHYPLSQRFNVLGEERGYFQHAATALVHAASGRVRFYISPSPEPVAMSWLAYFPAALQASHVDTAGGATDAPAAHGRGARAGTCVRSRGFPRRESRGATFRLARRRRLVRVSRAGACGDPHTQRCVGTVAAARFHGTRARRDRGLGRCAARDVVASRSTTASRWGAVVDRMRMTDTLLHETGTVRTPLRVVPLEDARSTSNRPFNCGLARRRRSFASRRSRRQRAASVRRCPPRWARVAHDAAAERAVAPDLRLRADSLYRAMRDALSHGDWATFGRAFDALGLALRVTAP